MKLSCIRLLFLIAVLTATGCQPEESVTIQRVPKEQSGYLSYRQNSAASQGGASAMVALTPEQMTDRMLVAIYPLESAMWFFKINGTMEQVKPWETELIEFFESIKFEAGPPKWELPENWTMGEARPMRFATLRIGAANPPLELSISSLPAPQDVLLNINRWRGQMGLSTIKQDQLEDATRPLKSNVDNAILFDVVGKFGGGMMGASNPNGPMANFAPPPSPTASDRNPQVVIATQFTRHRASGKKYHGQQQ